MSAKRKRQPVHVWAVIDMHYKPHPVAIDASANRDAANDAADEGNAGLLHARYRVVRCDGLAP